MSDGVPTRQGRVRMRSHSLISEDSGSVLDRLLKNPLHVIARSDFATKQSVIDL